MNVQPDLSVVTQPVSSLVVPAAGLGTRMYPATLTIPKGLLPLGQHTVIDEVLNEACAAGITTCVMVVGHGEDLYRRYLTQKPRLSRARQNSRKTPLPNRGDWSDKIEIRFVRQERPLGLCDAILLGAHILQSQSIAVVIPDTVVVGDNVLRAAIALAQQSDANVLSVDEADPNDVGNFGVVDPGEYVEGGFYVRDIVEKPKRGAAPSNKYFNGRAILTSGFLNALEDAVRSADETEQFGVACRSVADTRRILAVETGGITFDCGSLSGWHAANCHFFGKAMQ